MTREDYLNDAGIAVDPPTPLSLPFGRYRGRALDTVPLLYLHWLVRDKVVSGPLADAVRDVLARRTPAPALQQAVRQRAILDIVGATRRKLAHTLHPDVGGDTSVMQAVNTAFDWLEAQIRAVQNGAR